MESMIDYTDNTPKPEMAERIPPEVWMNSHRSIARHYGGCTINGVRYTVEYKPGKIMGEMLYGDLVRDDVIKRGAKEAKAQKKSARQKVADDIAQLKQDLFSQTQPCPHGDPLCPCQDGDACHYEGKNPMHPPIKEKSDDA